MPFKDAGANIHTPIERVGSSVMQARHVLILLPKSLVGLALLAAVFLAALRFDTFPVGAFFDDAHYIILAESLARGEGYRLLNQPAAPVERAFPMGWPLLLTPVAYLFPGNYNLFKLVTLAFWLVSLPLLARLFAARLHGPLLTLYLGLVAVNPQLIHFSGLVMSELSYLFFSVLTLVLYERWLRRDRASNPWLPVLVIICLLCTVTIRTIGVVLIISLLVHQLLYLTNRRQVLILIALLIAGALPLAWFNQQNGGVLFFSPVYTRHANNIISEFWMFLSANENIPASAHHLLANLVVPIFDLNFTTALIGPTVQGVLSVGVLSVLAGGFLVALRRRHPLEIYILFYLGLLYFWVVYTNVVQVRLWVPIIPFLLYYLITAVSWVVDRLPVAQERQRIAVVTGVIGLFILLALGRNLYEWRHPYQERLVNLTLGNQWIAEHTAPDAVVMSLEPQPDYLYSRRRTLPFPPTPHMEIGSYIDGHHVTHILIRPSLLVWDNAAHHLDSYTTFHLLPYLQADTRRYQLVYHNDNQNVFVYATLP